jgi:hypothetical protein
MGTARLTVELPLTGRGSGSLHTLQTGRRVVSRVLPCLLLLDLVLRVHSRFRVHPYLR